jgi:hypothetical protein
VLAAVVFLTGTCLTLPIASLRMAIRWSRLHAVLGESPADLTFGQIERAIAQQVVEYDDLDWKRAVPSKEGADELAKDIAAMANSRGGLIVYGVDEEPGTGAAKVVKSVAADEAELRRIRATALTRIQPGVVIDLEVVTSEDGTQTVLVLQVPASELAPHLVQNGHQWLGAPYRSGPDTHWMREPDLARAYGERMSRSRSVGAWLAEDLNAVTELLNLDRGSWIVGVAHRLQPLPAVLSPATREQVREVMERSLTLGSEIFGSNQQRYRPVRDLGDAALNPRVGLRRWVMQTTRDGSPDSLAEDVLVELRHDGSVAFACSTEGWYAPVLEDKHQVPAALVAGHAADFTALVAAVMEQYGDSSGMTYRIGLVRPAPDKPFAAIDVQRAGGITFNVLEQPSWSRTVRRFTPVVGEFPGVAEADAWREIARQMALDTLNQFGISNVPDI